MDSVSSRQRRTCITGQFIDGPDVRRYTSAILGKSYSGHDLRSDTKITCESSSFFGYVLI
jgi:hypothetical protein